MKNFLKKFQKYKLIIFLIFLIIVLIFTKIYFGQNNSSNNTTENNNEKTNITPTININSINSLSDQELNQLSDQLTRKLYSIKDDEQIIKFLDSLSDEEKDLLKDYEPGYEFRLILPYETDTFILNEYLEANRLLATIKGEDFKKSQEDAQDWINKNAEEPQKITIVWKQ